MTQTLPRVLRPATPDDAPFVYSSWLRNQRYVGDHARTRGRVYFKREHDRIEALVQRSAVVVACNPDYPDQIYGFAVASRGAPPIVHFVYVKHVFRKQGIATDMLCAVRPNWPQGITVTSTPVARSMADRYSLVYDPAA